MVAMFNMQTKCNFKQQKQVQVEYYLLEDKLMIYLLATHVFVPSDTLMKKKLLCHHSRGKERLI